MQTESDPINETREADGGAGTNNISVSWHL